MASTKEMQDICIKISPEFCCIVPERREELTTEGGLDVIKKFNYLKEFIKKLRIEILRFHYSLIQISSRFNQPMKSVPMQ